MPVADPRGPAHATPGKAPAADDHESQAALQRARVAAGAVERTSAEMEAVALAVGSLVAEVRRWRMGSKWVGDQRW